MTFLVNCLLVRIMTSQALFSQKKKKKIKRFAIVIGTLGVKNLILKIYVANYGANNIVPFFNREDPELPMHCRAAYAFVQSGLIFFFSSSKI